MKYGSTTIRCAKDAKESVTLDTNRDHLFICFRTGRNAAYGGFCLPYQEVPELLKRVDQDAPTKISTYRQWISEDGCKLSTECMEDAVWLVWNSHASKTASGIGSIKLDETARRELVSFLADKGPQLPARPCFGL